MDPTVLCSIGNLCKFACHHSSESGFLKRAQRGVFGIARLGKASCGISRVLIRALWTMFVGRKSVNKAFTSEPFLYADSIPGISKTVPQLPKPITRSVDLSCGPPLSRFILAAKLEDVDTTECTDNVLLMVSLGSLNAAEEVDCVNASARTMPSERVVSLLAPLDSLFGG